MSNLWVNPLDFLKSKGIIKEDKTEFIIQFQDGKQIELVALFEEYKELVLKDCK